jgi:hypothetical protein
MSSPPGSLRGSSRAVTASRGAQLIISPPDIRRAFFCQMGWEEESNESEQRSHHLFACAVEMCCAINRATSDACVSGPI